MKYTFEAYRHSEGAFLEVESFLSASYPYFPDPVNWFIDRWNFTATVSRVMHNIPVELWQSRIGLWRDETGRLISMAHEEEAQGDQFFDFAHPDYIKQDLLKEMFEFSEEHCLCPRGESQRGFALRIHPRQDMIRHMAEDRGYRKLEYTEPLSKKLIKMIDPPSNPPGLKLISGKQVDPAAKALAHARAFGYYQGTEASYSQSILAFRELPSAPSYREDLDLAFLDERGNIAAFAGFWIDLPNSMAILEPLGTCPEYRRMGLARKLLEEGERRLAEQGITRLYVGADQPFYLSQGFQLVNRLELWEYIH